MYAFKRNCLLHYTLLADNIYTYTYTHTHMERALFMEYKAEVAPVQQVNTPQQVTSELYRRFTDYLDTTPKTIATYTGNIKQFARYLERQNIKQPTRADILNYREELKGKYKATTVQNYIEAVKLFFKWTAQEGLYPNIADHIKGATISKEHKKDYLTSEQVKAVLNTVQRDTLQGKRDYALLALMVTGGLRDIEIHRANVEDLRTLGNNTVLYLQGKGQDEKADYIKVMPAVEAALREYLTARGQPDAREPLFVSLSMNSKGKRLSTRTISGTVKKYLIAAGYNSERLTAHSLRHTAVTLSLIGGNSLREVQQFARHTNITTTQIYAHDLERVNNNCEATIASSIFE